MYQEDIKRILKHLLIKYESEIALNKGLDRKVERISVIELSILEYVEAHACVTQNDILELFPMKRGKLIGILKKLVDAHYLDKQKNDTDKRSSYIVIGHLGRVFLKKYHDHEDNFLNFVLKDMTINEEKAIVKFLSKINQSDYVK